MATNTYVALDKKTVDGTVSTITFSSIPATYTDLVIVSNYGNDSAGNYAIRVGNGSVDTGSNYSRTCFYGTGSAPGSFPESNQTYLNLGNSNTSITCNSITQFNNYANTTTFKSFLDRSNATSATLSLNACLWRSTNAINTIQLFSPTSSNFLAGSTFSLYGIKGTATGTGTAKATGGTITYDSFGYVMHTFTSTGTFTPSANLTCDYLVVAGGGGGGLENAGGGGAGGLLSTVTASGGGGGLQSPIALTSSTAYTVTVGGGGAGSNSTSSRGTNGINSSISGSGLTTITSIGGGGGGTGSGDGSWNSGSNGGSGGGLRGNRNGAISGTGTAGQGYGAGNPPTPAGYASSGGGGAGAPSLGATNGSVGTVGGAGLAVAISGSSVTYAGGGGASWNGTSSVGGSSIGGNGGSGSGAGGNGSTNTGSGGGGGGDSQVSGTGGAGGSGIVVIKYYGL
jgi:hypothetical protein